MNSVVVTVVVEVSGRLWHCCWRWWWTSRGVGVGPAGVARCIGAVEILSQ